MGALATEVQSEINGSDAPDPSPAESEVHKLSDLRSYHFDQTNNDTPEEDDNLSRDPCKSGTGKGMGT
jgi:hypothetical protein